MSEEHPVHYIVRVYRNNAAIHVQEAASREEAEALKARFEQVPHSEAEIEEVHEDSETDLTTKTREIVETIAADAQN